MSDDPLADILKAIEDLDDQGLGKGLLADFFSAEAGRRGKAGLEALWDDLYGLAQYLSRTDRYPSPTAIPFWEFSLFLEWADGHLMFGDAFDLSLKNARRALGNIRAYFAYLRDRGEAASTAEIDRAIVELCSGKRLELVVDIPFTGAEFYTSVAAGGKKASFDIADYWLLALLEVDYGNDWSRLRDEAGAGRRGKIDELRRKLGLFGYSGLKDLAHADLYEHELGRARDWLFGRGPYRGYK